MKRIRFILSGCILSLLIVLSDGFRLTDTDWVSVAATGTSITVDTTIDDIDINSNCTLREAIIAANTNQPFDNCPAGSGTDTIILPAGTYTITQGPPGDNNAQSGDLDILSAMTIQGAGAGSTVIEGNGLYRALQIHMGIYQVSIHGVTIQNSSDDGYASGIYNEGRLSLKDIYLKDNQNEYGISNWGVLEIDQSVITNNSAGGIENIGVLTITHSLIEGNSLGGGIANEGTAKIVGTTISGNTSNFSNTGGGLGNDFIGVMTIKNSTISGNFSSSGGGILNTSDASLNINNCTITQNQAVTGFGGGIANTSRAVLTLSNTIVAGNSAQFAARADCYLGSGGMVNSMGFNLLGSGCNFRVDPSDLRGVDPLLGSLADYGGGLPTHALLWPSPAIDAGNQMDPGTGNYSCEPLDQRRITRPQYKACDIGAFEANIPPQFLPIIRK